MATKADCLTDCDQMSHCRKASRSEAKKEVKTEMGEEGIDTRLPRAGEYL